MITPVIKGYTGATRSVPAREILGVSLHLSGTVRSVLIPRLRITGVHWTLRVFGDHHQRQQGEDHPPSSWTSCVDLASGLVRLSEGTYYSLHYLQCYIALQQM